MRILLLTKRFPPEVPATAVLGRELAEDLARQGFQVTVAAGYPHHPYGRLFPGYRQRLVRREWQNGFLLVRGPHLIHSSQATLVRALVMASQCASYLLSSAVAQRPHVVISFDGYPLLGPITGALLARCFGAKLISVIYDIYPDIAVELGKLRNPALIALAQRLEGLTYRYSEQIVVLSEGFRRTLLGKGVSATKLAVIPVWLDSTDIAPLPRINPWRREMEIGPEKFVVLYAGTIGLISGAEVIVEVAQRLASYPDIVFLLVGDGYGKKRVADRSKDLGLRNVRFLPFQPRERLSELQATADVSLVTLAPGRGRTSLPSKILGYMAAQRPVIASVDEDCDTAEMIRTSRGGLTTAPGEAEVLAKAILFYYQNPESRETDAARGREYFWRHYERQAITKRYGDIIREITQS